jgi:maltose alpha-D-glucosyltransferase/alpha-amylase
LTILPEERRVPKHDHAIDDNPVWYQDAVIYEIHLRAFSDGDGDGIGDFKGLTAKLDYLEGLGVTAIWLLPFYPSPLRDDGYDISDYHNIHPMYGTMRDFKEFLKAAHQRGLRVITELVLNHTSDQHEWFQRARRAKVGSTARNFYVWSDTINRYQDARIIFKDFEASNWSWDPVAKAYYWHRFYAHQPDLNFDNPEVRKALLNVVDYWFDLGVDGLRLDAVPYLFEREGTNCENLPETHAFLRTLRRHIDQHHKRRMLLAEANQWPEDAAAYFGHGDECHMAFHFPLMPRMFMALQMEDRFPIIDILGQTPAIPEGSQWAMFLRNHDELTLEMVTDEERDYMYQVYARDPTARINLGIRRRLAPLLENDRRKIELMNVLLITMPGTPVLYYGDEIGMGDNHYLGDRNGVRTPMQWSADRNAGFSRSNPQKLYLPIIIDPEYHYEALNVETQEHNQASLLWWVKRLIAIRKHSTVFGRGGIEFLYPDNSKILAFVRTYQEERVLVVVNLSRHPQTVELDLSSCAGCVPEEVFGQTRFAMIKDAPYVLTLGAHGYYLFNLNAAAQAAVPGVERPTPELGAIPAWDALLQPKLKAKLERDVLPLYLPSCRWYGGKTRVLQQITIAEDIPVSEGAWVAHLLLLECQYLEGLPDRYLLPLAFVSDDEMADTVKGQPQGAIARLTVGTHVGYLRDGIYDERFRRQLVLAIAKRQRIKGAHGELIGSMGKALRPLLQEIGPITAHSQLLKAEQSNSSALFSNRLYFKLYRRLEEGINPDIEVTQVLTEEQAYPFVPPFAGALEYRKKGGEPTAVALLQGCIANQGDAWSYTLDELARYIERVLSKAQEPPDVLDPSLSPLAIAYRDIPSVLQEVIGGVYLGKATLLGRRTAELHRALSPEHGHPAFMPEPFTQLYQRSIFQSMQSYARRVLQQLRKQLKSLPDAARAEAEQTLAREADIIDRFKAVLKQNRTGARTRIHGDYHLGQILTTGDDVIIIDFEGEPARPLSERRSKRSPLRDLAGMLRSFHYAAHTALRHHALLRHKDTEVLEPWLAFWHRYVGGVFLRSYLETAGDAIFVPKDLEETDILLNAFLLHKALYELHYEMDSRPDWVMTPLAGITEMLKIKGSAPMIVEIQKAYPLGPPSP